ncbi:hypothetical protein [uncultured Aquimarina sp.]|uniref:hypothetical protein n=1 Tax=uncultured Aquimarina sp. TaxID=575652 RepID=UPI002626D8C0|nr:hypothetical protein [uncultured Aquimarina sp.]
MTALQQYNNLDGKVIDRKRINEILKQARKEKEKRVVRKLSTLLSRNKDKTFEISVTKKLIPVAKKKKITKKKVVAQIPTKKKEKLKVYGLSIPYVDLVATSTLPLQVQALPVVEQPIKILPEVSTGVRMKDPITLKPKIAANTPRLSTKRLKGVRTMADLDRIAQPTETYVLNSEIGAFLGKLEKKPKGSVVITLDAPAGSGKTRFFFQVMEDYASSGKRCLFLTLEEHSQSQLFKDKRDDYISSENHQHISIVDAEEIKTYKDLRELIDTHDIILVDSFGKLKKLIKELKLELDEHLRIAYDGKLFFLIFQRTTGKTMRGGADSEFDGDVILQVEKPTENYQENFVTARKNRYNAIPNLKYNVYHQKIIQEDEVAITKERSIPPKPKRKLVVHSLDG